MKTSRWFGLFLVGLLGVGVAPARAETFSIKVGALFPQGKSDIWEQNKFETDLTMSDMIGGDVGIGFDVFLADILNAGFSISFYNRERTVEDRDFVFPDGFPILRTLSLTVVPVELGVKFLPMGRNRRAIPYLGGGLGLYVWEYRENGDFVADRFGDPYIASGDFRSSGADIGWHGEAGMQIPWGRRTSVDWEIKYYRVNGDLGRDFDPGFEPIDLSGWVLSLGLSFWW